MALPSTIVQIIQALPPTITNLEIDSSCFVGGHDEVHLCDHIGRLIPQLRVLRLRLPRVCKNLMNQLEESPGRVSQLQVAVIRILRKRLTALNPTAQNCHALKPSFFIHMLSKHLNRNAFPWLQNFLVIEKMELGNDGLFILISRDAYTDTRKSFEYRGIDSRSFRERKVSSRNSERNLVSWSEDDFLSYAEGNSSWTTLPHGSRLPSLLGSDQEDIYSSD